MIITKVYTRKGGSRARRCKCGVILANGMRHCSKITCRVLYGD